MLLKLISIGKSKAGPYQDLCADYQNRIVKFNPFQNMELPAEKIKTSSNIEVIKNTEAKKILAALPKSGICIALDERGEQMCTEVMSKKIQQWMNQGVKEIVWCMGGAWGLAAEVKKQCQYSWALSNLTLPHDLAKLVFLEQLYRSFTIIKGITYHYDA